MHSGLTLNHAFSLGHGSIKVLPTPDNTAQQRNKGMAKNHSKSLVSNISGKYWEELCMTGNEMATSDCLGGWISCLQLLHAFAIPSMRLMWNRLQKKIGLMTSLRRLLKTSWQRKDVWKTLFQNKSSGTINPVYLPHKTPEQHKECVNQQNTVYHNSQQLPKILSCNFGGTSQWQTWPRSCSVLKKVQWKEIRQLLYFGLGVGRYWRVSSWATSETYTCYKVSYCWIVACMLTGAVLSKLPHPNGFGLGFRSTLQGAHAEKSDSGTLVICIKHNQHFTQTPLFSTKREQGEHLSFAPGRAGCGAFGLRPDVKYSLMSEGFQSLNSSGTCVSFRTLSMTCSLSLGCKVFKNLRACSLDHLYTRSSCCCCSARRVRAPLRSLTSWALSRDCVMTIRWCPSSWAARVSSISLSPLGWRPLSNVLSRTIWRRIPCFWSRLKKERATSAASSASCKRKNFWRFEENSPRSITVMQVSLVLVCRTASKAAIDLPTPGSA